VGNEGGGTRDAWWIGAIVAPKMLSLEEGLLSAVEQRDCWAVQEERPR